MTIRIPIATPLDEWVDRAACRNSTDDFFPADWHADTKMQALKKKYCDGCDVGKECLEYAIVNRELEGLWCMTPTERRYIMRRDRIRRRQEAEG